MQVVPSRLSARDNDNELRGWHPFLRRYTKPSSSGYAPLIHAGLTGCFQVTASDIRESRSIRASCAPPKLICRDPGTRRPERPRGRILDRGLAHRPLRSTSTEYHIRRRHNDLPAGFVRRPTHYRWSLADFRCSPSARIIQNRRIGVGWNVRVHYTTLPYAPSHCCRKLVKAAPKISAVEYRD